jgi:AcrR family transcriptional regulator
MFEKKLATGKGEETRARILDSALDLFRRDGFDQTTMREIAAEAGVSLGNAYYYFASKEALVMAFYERASEEMAPAIEEALAGAKGLEKRLNVILAVKFQYFGPNRTFLGALMRHAADPQNPLSPFGAATRHIRERDMDYFAKAIQGSRLEVPKDLKPHVPKLLWLHQMGLILFWIYDRSKGQQRTHLLREKSLALVATGLKVASFPLLRPLRKRIVELVLTAEGKIGNA